MASLLELENGDIWDLQGRSIVYSRYLGEPKAGSPVSEEQIIAMFFTTHPADFAEQFGVPEGGLKELAKKAEEAQAAHPDTPSGVLPIYGARLDIDIADVKIASEDVIFVGEFTDPKRCLAAIQIGAQLYMMQYNEQLMTRSGIRAETTPTTEEQPRTTYKDVGDPQMSSYLQSHYIAPIIHALDDGDRALASETVHDFVRFCGDNGPLTEDAYALAAVVTASPSAETRPLLYKYFDKILAVASERFEDAARLRDEIKAMKGTGSSNRRSGA